MSYYGHEPDVVGSYPDVNLIEMMHYLYLPVQMVDEYGFADIRVPKNVQQVLPLINSAIAYATCKRALSGRKPYKYAYLTARKGWATRDNPINRPGWHCDGFGTEDLNFIWWSGPGTRFATNDFLNISDDDLISMQQFEKQAVHNGIEYPERTLYALDPFVVHATPLIEKGCMRQFIKVSLSDHKYNLENNSHNYDFDYDWPMHSRDNTRNDPHKAAKDYAS